MALTSLLPQPMHTTKSKWDNDDSDSDDDAPTATLTLAKTNASQCPAYGKRKGWIPRKPEDYGDGGAFPEIHVAQFPLGMGEKDTKGNAGAVVPVTLDAEGKVQYDALLRQGQGKDKIIHSTYDALVPVAIVADDPKRELPDENAIREATLKTKKQFEEIVDGAMAAAAPTKIKKQQLDAQFIRYTSAQQGEALNSGAQQRVIRMVNVQNDPMEPPRFLTNKKIPRGPPSPPAPVLHSPSRKVTAEEQSDWKIPPCVSNWKNQKGHTIPLHIRLAADGRGLQDVTVNDRFAKLSEAMYITERESRQAIAMRQKIGQMAADREKEQHEEKLRFLAQAARQERVGGRPANEAEAEEVRERDTIREERHRDRQRESRMSAAAPDKRNALSRDKERDVSERIALGLPAQSTGGGGFDTRLYNQSQGMSSGFKGDDAYDVYDKAFRGESAKSIYRPTRGGGSQDYTEDEINDIKTADKFHRPDKGFNGTEGPRVARDGPVQFEKQPEEDVFGLDKFLEEAKASKKRGNDGEEDRGKRQKR